MKFLNKYIILTIFLSVFTVSFGQNTKSSYFVEGSLYRNYENPAFGAMQKGWFGGILSNISVKADLPFSYSDLYRVNPDGKLGLIFSNKQYMDEFYKNSLSSKNSIYENFNMNLLSFGWGNKKRQFRFDANLRQSMYFNVPKDLFGAAFYLIPANSSLDLSAKANLNIGFDFGFGMSQKITPDITIGFKVKYIMAMIDASLNLDKLQITSKSGAINGNDIQKGSLDIALEATIEQSLPVFLAPSGGSISDIKFNLDNLGISALTKPGGFGLGVDLGIEWKMLDEHLKLSAAIVDLGFLSIASSQIHPISIKGEYSYSGVNYDIDGGTNFDEIKDDFSKVLKVDTPRGNFYTNMLQTKVNIGAEYAILKNRIGFGFLSTNQFVGKDFFYNFVGSANFRPLSWLDISLTYGAGKSGFGPGFALCIHGAAMNWYLSADNLPVTFAPSGIPTKIRSGNIQLGFNWAWGNLNKKKFNDDSDIDDDRIDF